MFGSRPEDAFMTSAGGVAGGSWRLILLIAAGLAVFFAWAATYEIEEVARGSGRVIPSQQIQVVQSLEGGILRDIAVREGDVVEPGAVLLTIDDTGFSAQRGELLEREAALLAEILRLRAEVAFADALTPPPALAARAAGAVAAQRDILSSRRQQLQSELAVLRNQLSQREGERRELQARIARTEAILAPLRDEVRLTEDLAERGVVPEVDLLRLRARVAELEGDLAVGRARLPTLAAATEEAANQIEAARSSYVLTARQRLAQVQVELAVVQETLRAATDRVSRTELRAPVRGTVNTVHVTTVGAVVQPGVSLVEIVPIDDQLLIEADIRARDVAFVRPGEPASVKITAYDYLVYGALDGEVLRIGADATRSDTGEAFFKVIIQTQDTNLGGEAADLPISPGMVASVDIQTGRKTVLSYLSKPLLRAQSEALRER